MLVHYIMRILMFEFPVLYLTITIKRRRYGRNDKCRINLLGVRWNELHLIIFHFGNNDKRSCRQASYSVKGLSIVIWRGKRLTSPTQSWVQCEVHIQFQVVSNVEMDGWMQSIRATKIFLSEEMQTRNIKCEAKQ